MAALEVVSCSMPSRFPVCASQSASTCQASVAAPRRIARSAQYPATWCHVAMSARRFDFSNVSRACLVHILALTVAAQVIAVSASRAADINQEGSFYEEGHVAALAAPHVYRSGTDGLVAGEGEFVRAEARPDIPMADKELIAAPLNGEPEQVHVAIAGPGRMSVTWLTAGDDSSVVHFGTSPDSLDMTAVGSSSQYSYLMYRSGHIHTAILGDDISPLLPDSTYFYQLGDLPPDDQQTFSFVTPPRPGNIDKPMNISVVGDLGQTGWSVSTLEHIKEREHALLLYAGDLSYADRYQPRWDTWSRLIQPLASSRPWMMVEGNHEIENLPSPFSRLVPPFMAYNARFPMAAAAASGSPSNLFYSFEAGGVHFLMLGSYADYWVGSEQYQWLQQDLASVDRSRTPWLIAVLHAPWYNSNTVHQGDGEEMRRAMERLLVDSQLDIMFSGHVHAYERTTRVFNLRPHPSGAVHIVVGDGGNREGLASRYLEPQPEWSLMREASFGHGELEIQDAYTARWRWYRNQDDVGIVADDVIITSHAANKEASERNSERTLSAAGASSAA